MSIGLTKRQSECLAFLRAYMAERGQPPSYSEIGKHLGVKSKSNVTWLLRSLAERGTIRLTPYKTRSIELIEPDSITLNPEIARLVRSYAEQEGIKTETAVNELLRQTLGAAA